MRVSQCSVHVRESKGVHIRENHRFLIRKAPAFDPWSRDWEQGHRRFSSLQSSGSDAVVGSEVTAETAPSAVRVLSRGIRHWGSRVD